MSKAEDLLNSLDEPVVEHIHEVVDTDGCFIIDPYTRMIRPSDNYELIVMQGDHNSERCTFKLPRYIEQHDMAECNKVKLHYINIGSGSDEQYADVVDMDDFGIDPDDEDTVTCSWLITRNATQFAGSISVLLEYQCVNYDGSVPYEWNTDIYSGITVKKSMDNSKQVVSKYSDILEQWRSMLFSNTNSPSGGGSGLPIGASPNQQLVTDSAGNIVWEDKTHYYDPITNTYHQLDSKYIPDDIARKDDVEQTINNTLEEIANGSY